MPQLAPAQITAVTPAVAKVVKLIFDRPAWLMRDPLEIPPDLYQDAHAEMHEIMRARGWFTPTDASLKRHNFILCGVAICARDDGND